MLSTYHSQKAHRLLQLILSPKSMINDNPVATHYSSFQFSLSCKRQLNTVHSMGSPPPTVYQPMTVMSCPNFRLGTHKRQLQQRPCSDCSTTRPSRVTMQWHLIEFGNVHQLVSSLKNYFCTLLSIMDG